MPDLTCAVVHWNTPELLADCVTSLLAETARLAAAGLHAEVVVVDSGSRPAVRARLDTLLPAGATLLAAETNCGYGSAANLAFARSTAPLFLVSNADVLYLPGSLAALVELLRARPEVALAGPASWWDRSGRSSSTPASRRIASGWRRMRRRSPAPRGRRSARLAADGGDRLRDRRARGRALDCLLARREPVVAAGGLFDPSFFLYYEDTDLCRRLRDRALPILYEPRAQIVHLFNQSRSPQAAARLAASRRQYLDKHYGATEAEHLLALAAASVPGEADFREWGLRDLGTPGPPPRFVWESDGESLFTLGLNPQIVPAALARCARPALALTGSFWEQLVPGTYWARATDPAGERVHGYWRFARPYRRPLPPATVALPAPFVSLPSPPVGRSHSSTG